MNKNGSIKIVLVAIFALILVVPMVYFFVWRTSDGDYKTAESKIKTMNTNVQTVSDGIKIIQYPGFIDGTTPTALKKISDSYQTAAAELASSPVTSRDLSVSSQYHQYSASITSYGQSISALAASVKDYVEILNSCEKMRQQFGTVKSMADFDKISTSCTTAIDSVKTSPSKQFNNIFLNEYSKDASGLVDAYRKTVNANNSEASVQALRSAITQATLKIAAIGSKKIDYALPDPTQALKNLNSMVIAQRYTFWR